MKNWGEGRWWNGVINLNRSGGGVGWGKEGVGSEDCMRKLVFVYCMYMFGQKG